MLCFMKLSFLATFLLKKANSIPISKKQKTPLRIAKKGS